MRYLKAGKKRSMLRESEIGGRVKTERDTQKERCVRCEWRVCAGRG